jgi:hypothetical protein
MASTTSWLSRDQQAQVDFARNVGDLRAFVAQFAPGPAERAVDVLAGATRRFGACELSIREAERLQVVGRYAQSAKTLHSRGLRDNDRGLAALAGLEDFLVELEKAQIEDDARSRWKAESKDVHDQWHEQLAKLDVGEADARHLMNMTKACFGALDEAGPVGLAAYLRKEVAELQAIRQEPGRGTEAHSFPWWKIVAAAIWLGVTAYAVWRAVTFGANWWDYAMIIFIALVGVILIALGC